MTIVEQYRSKQAGDSRSALHKVAAVWVLLFINVLTFTTLPTLLHVPHRIGQLVTQGSLPVALVIALMCNRKGLIKTNLFLGLFSLLALTSFMMSVRLVGIGTLYRGSRLVLFVVILWLLTPWWGRRDLFLARVHLRVLTVVTFLVAIGALLAHHKAFETEGRLSGTIWPIDPPGVAHYSAEVVGLTVILWLCGIVKRRYVMIVVPVGLAVLLLSHTRTALLALALGLLVAGGSLLITRRKVRVGFVSVVIIAVVLGPLAAPAVTHWLERGEDTQELTSLTGRTSAWNLVLSTHEPETNKILGQGITNDSVDGLPIDDSWLTLYQNSGIVGDIVAGALFLLLIVAAGFAPAGPARALAVFLIVFCLMSSFTETGLGNASPYMLDLTVAASLLSPVLKLKRPALREAV